MVGYSRKEKTDRKKRRSEDNESSLQNTSKILNR